MVLSLRLPCFFFFFSSRRRHTRFSRDWSSDVCSSDLLPPWNRCLSHAPRRRAFPSDGRDLLAGGGHRQTSAGNLHPADSTSPALRRRAVAASGLDACSAIPRHRQPGGRVAPSQHPPACIHNGSYPFPHPVHRAASPCPHTPSGNFGPPVSSARPFAAGPPAAAAVPPSEH